MLWLAASIASLLWIVWLVVLLKVEKRGNYIGDGYGSLNTLFTGAAFLGLLWQIHVQRIESSQRADREHALTLIEHYSQWYKHAGEVRSAVRRYRNSQSQLALHPSGSPAWVDLRNQVANDIEKADDALHRLGHSTAMIIALEPNEPPEIVPRIEEWELAATRPTSNQVHEAEMDALTDRVAIHWVDATGRLRVKAIPW